MTKERYFAHIHNHGQVDSPIERVYWDEEKQHWMRETNYVSGSKSEWYEPAEFYVPTGYGVEQKDATDRDIANELNDYGPYKNRYNFRKVSGKQANAFIEAKKAEYAEDDRAKEIWNMRPKDSGRGGEQPWGHHVAESPERAEYDATWARSVGDWPVVVHDRPNEYKVIQYRRKPDFQATENIYPVNWGMSQSEAMEKWNEKNGSVFSQEEISRARQSGSPSHNAPSPPSHSPSQTPEVHQAHELVSIHDIHNSGIERMPEPKDRVRRR